MVPMMVEKNRRLFDAFVENGGDDGIPMMDDEANKSVDERLC